MEMMESVAAPVETFNKEKVSSVIQQLQSWNVEPAMISLYLSRQSDRNMARLVQEDMNYLVNVRNRQLRLQLLRTYQKVTLTLQSYKSIPENGLIIFSGEDPTKEPTESILICFEPFREVEEPIFRVQSTFYLQPLENMLTAEANSQRPKSARH